MGGRSGGVGAAARWLAVRPLFATRSAAAAEVARALARIAPTDLPVILEGETGCGKSLLAKKIHQSSRAGRKFVVVDCGALPPSLAAAELFGHTPGAFTDATRARRGWLEQGGDGSVVLDRVEALAGEVQVALLRVLEERRFVPVGGVTPRPLRARLIATATADLAQCLAEGRLRRDLYHRLAGFHARIPPLRARLEDILPASRALLRRFGRRLGRVFTLERACEEILLAYPWPGNFRELEGVLLRGCLACEGELIRLEHLGLPAGQWQAVAEWGGQQRRSLREMSRLYALWVLAAEGGNVSRAARLLGVSRRTLIRWRAGQGG